VCVGSSLRAGGKPAMSRRSVLTASGGTTKSGFWTVSTRLDGSNKVPPGPRASPVFGTTSVVGLLVVASTSVTGCLLSGTNSGWVGDE
jgi:hypothetical protein